MGTSTCHIILADSAPVVPGACGVVKDGVIPGCYGYEAGQSAVGEIFGWFVEHSVPPLYHEKARARGVTVHEILEEEAAALKPGESGLLALDWWNGNRSVLVDADLTGLMLGMTLLTQAPEMYRALIEATAFGTRTIIDAFEAGGIKIDNFVACGGLPERNKLLMQIYADVTGRTIQIAASDQTPALGSAMFGAVAAGSAAGGYATIEAAAERMAHLRDAIYEPIEANRRVYDELYAVYTRLHDLFGRPGGDPAMKTLKKIRVAAKESDGLAILTPA
jgi:L-ribulokinase